MLPADGSSTRGGSTSVRGQVRSPHTSGGRPACLGSCATQPAFYSPGWDRQTDGQTDRRIAVSLNAPIRRGHNNRINVRALLLLVFLSDLAVLLF